MNKSELVEALASEKPDLQEGGRNRQHNLGLDGWRIGR
jgi:hypothetical protein